MRRKWERHRDPANKYAGSLTLGDKHAELPEACVISVTRGENFNIPRLIINGLVNQLVMNSLEKNEDLIYAELTGNIQGGIGQTMTVWKSGKTMNSFRTTGIHNFARKFFSWVFYSGKVQSYFYTWKADTVIPSADEAMHKVKTEGRHYDGGRLVKRVSKANNGINSTTPF